MTDPEQGERPSVDEWYDCGSYGDGLSAGRYRPDGSFQRLDGEILIAYLNTLEATAARVEGLEQALRRIEEDPYDGRFVAAQARNAHQGTAEDGKDG